jgi:hypothetical protein
MDPKESLVDLAFQAVVMERPGLKTGFPVLDRLMDIGSGLITLRSGWTGWLSLLAVNLLVRNHVPDKPTLYLHWVDYHRRYWTLDFDQISGLTKRLGKDLASVSEQTFFIRAFSRDNAEAEGNWSRIFRFPERDGLNFAILDSASELYETEQASRPGKPRLKNRIYSLSMFSRLCLMNSCPGVVLDHSSMPIHPFLGEVSSIVIEFTVSDSLMANLVKHPRRRSRAFAVARPRSETLRRWLS